MHEDIGYNRLLRTIIPRVLILAVSVSLIVGPTYYAVSGFWAVVVLFFGINALAWMSIFDEFLAKDWWNLLWACVAATTVGSSAALLVYNSVPHIVDIEGFELGLALTVGIPSTISVFLILSGRIRQPSLRPGPSFWFLVIASLLMAFPEVFWYLPSPTNTSPIVSARKSARKAFTKFDHIEKIDRDIQAIEQGYRDSDFEGLTDRASIKKDLMEMPWLNDDALVDVLKTRRWELCAAQPSKRIIRLAASIASGIPLLGLSVAISIWLKVASGKVIDVLAPLTRIASELTTFVGGLVVGVLFFAGIFGAVDRATDGKAFRRGDSNFDSLEGEARLLPYIDWVEFSYCTMTGSESLAVKPANRFVRILVYSEKSLAAIWIALVFAVMLLRSEERLRS